MKLEWDKTGERLYHTGTDQGVLYIPNSAGEYTTGVAWNGLTGVTESPSGAEPQKQYADNSVYLTLVSAEEFGATIEAYMYPDEFEQFDGGAQPSPGLIVRQQSRRPFGLSYRTLLGNDLEGTDYGYIRHLVYSAVAAPTERGYQTVNDNPEAVTLSWELSTTPVYAGEGLKPTSVIHIDSTKADPDALAALEAMLHGTDVSSPMLPMPTEVIAMFEGTQTMIRPGEPTYSLGVLTIPNVAGAQYRMNSVNADPGVYTLTVDTLVDVIAKPGYALETPGDYDWYYEV